MVARLQGERSGLFASVGIHLVVFRAFHVQLHSGEILVCVNVESHEVHHGRVELQLRKLP